MEDFVAIDFETANRVRSSVCSVGMVFVRERCIVGTFSSLIRPWPNYYLESMTLVHHLTRADTDPFEHFPAIWTQMQAATAAVFPEYALRDIPFVAHNAPFDESCLLAALQRFDLANPHITFYDTLRQARQTVKGLPNYQLHTVAAHFGFDLTDHHNALPDAEACAVIALNVF